MARVGRVVAAGLALVGATAARVDGATPPPIPASADWLTTLNHYRSMAGLAPVVENPAWSAGAAAHSKYMVVNGVVTHDEVPGAPGYTAEGDEAGANGNVAVTSVATTSARVHIEQWMAGPFHAIGLLRPALKQTAFGTYQDASARPWRSAATLDVLRGIDRTAARPSRTVVFPGDGTTTSLDELAEETPDARELCGWTGAAGLPLLAMFPTAPGTSEASLVGPAGPVTTCALSAANTTGVARSILAGDHAVAVIPRVVLAPGRYTATVRTAGAGSTTWSFTVDPSVADGSGVVGTTPAVPTTTPTSAAAGFVPLPPVRMVDTRQGLGARRLVPFVTTPIDIAGRNQVPATATAISANITAVAPDAAGYLTVAPCGGTRPEVSTLNFTAGRAVANAALLPLDATGDLCVTSSAATDLLIDVNGAFGPTDGHRFVPVEPTRVLDTRSGAGGARRVPAGSTVVLPLRGVAPVAGTAVAVALTVTAVAPGEAAVPYVTVYPCGPRPEVSNLNLRTGETRPNLVVTPLATDGSICLFTTAPTDLLVDVSGYFAPVEGRQFTPLAPVRFLDTRQTDSRLNSGRGGERLAGGEVLRVPLAGQRGIPAGARAVSANLTITGALGAGYVSAFPCGTRPDASNLNYLAGSDVASAAQLVLDAEGAACFWLSASAYLIVDVSGAWT